MEAYKNSSHPPSVAFDESPAPMSADMGPTQIVCPEWGKYNKPGRILNLVETCIVEL